MTRTPLKPYKIDVIWDQTSKVTNKVNFYCLYNIIQMSLKQLPLTLLPSMIVQKGLAVKMWFK